jgi:hypothetical protein
VGTAGCCVRDSSVISKSTRAGLAGSVISTSFVSGLNAASSAETLYFPGADTFNKYWPLTSVLVVTEALVSLLTATTTAPGSGVLFDATRP